MSRSRSKASPSPTKTPESSKQSLNTSKRSLPAPKKSEDRTPTITPSDALDEQIRSKQRILALLDKRLEGSAVSQEQLEQRDRRIEELNARTIAAESKIKLASRASMTKLKEQVAKYQQDLHSSQVARLKYEDAIAQLRTELAEWKAKAEDEKESGALLNEALTEETEGLKAELEQRKSQSNEMKKDIIQLSKIIQDMTKLNSELNAKIDNQNRETATMNSNYFTAVAKAEQNEQLENELNEYIASSQRFEKQVGRLTESLDKSHRGRLAIEAASREAQTQLQQLTSMLNDLNAASATSDPRVVQVSNEIAQGLKAIRHRLKGVTPEENSKPPQEADESQLHVQLRDLKTQLKEKDRQLHRNQQDIIALRSRISRFESQLEKEKAEAQDSIDRSQKRTAVLLEQINHFTERFEVSRSELAKKDFELQKVQTQLLHLKDRIEEMKLKVKEYFEKSNSLERLMKEQRSSILRIQTERFDDEKKYAVKEKKMEKAMANYKAMQEELFHKDTEVMRKAKEAHMFSNQIEELESRFKATQFRSKSTSGEEAQDYLRKLEEKNREITILKEMIRGAQAEVKQKESLITRYRKRPEEILPTLRTMRNIDEDVAMKLEEFLASVEKAKTFTKKASQNNALVQAIEKLQQGLELDMKVSARRLKELVESPRLKQLISDDGPLSVQDLSTALLNWFKK